MQRRQLARLRRVEQRHLPLLLDALALLHHRRRRIDARLDARGRLLLFDLGRLDARLLGFDADRDIARHAAARTHPADAVPESGADPIDDGQPGHAECQRHAGHPGGQHEQRGTEEIEAGGEPVADELPDHAARGFAQHARGPSAASRARSSRTASA